MGKLLLILSVIVLLLLWESAIAATITIPVAFGDDGDGICKSMVESQGYTCQEHKVTTEDGYILSLQRIPVGISGNKATKSPVLLQHGLFMDAVTWLLNPPTESLAFILADDGYDVWLANTRGTNFSRGHTSLSPTDQDYWEWSWDELVAYDLPATLQYVHDQTGQSMHYVGHSLGTLIAFSALSEHKLLNLLRSAALLSPIAYLAQLRSSIAKFAANAYIAEALYKTGMREFDPREEAAINVLEDICKKTNNNCSDLMSSFTGPNCCVNSSRTIILLEHEPQSTATKNLIHIAQMVREGSITMYDYGSENENNKHYGQSSPPAYAMANIPDDFPLFLSYGGQDYLSDVNDVKILLDTLHNHNGDKLLVKFIEDYAHADFVFGVNAKQLVYDDVMNFFQDY
ncbi:triacylglycerol lipase 2-like [Ipomoea triloba]|uniref:triacylglycerol lipase 2-like n=1 Tax=Ipomoea triloba TaxID=35885 RepID=UPI00125DB568|nr:triacylglycerol lipase 2-like [Ipomoea triloba]